MTKWARVNENNEIIELTDVDPAGRFHEEIVWTEVPDTATLHIPEESAEPSPAPQGPALTAEEQAEADSLREAADAALAAQAQE